MNKDIAASTEQISAWKQQFGEVKGFYFPATANKLEALGYFKPLDLTTIAGAKDKLETDPSAAFDMICNSTFLGGTESILKDEMCRVKVATELMKGLEPREAEILNV